MAGLGCSENLSQEDKTQAVRWLSRWRRSFPESGSQGHGRKGWLQLSWLYYLFPLPHKTCSSGENVKSSEEFCWSLIKKFMIQAGNFLLHTLFIYLFNCSKCVQWCELAHFTDMTGTCSGPDCYDQRKKKTSLTRKLAPRRRWQTVSGD